MQVKRFVTVGAPVTPFTLMHMGFRFFDFLPTGVTVCDSAVAVLARTTISEEKFGIRSTMKTAKSMRQVIDSREEAGNERLFAPFALCLYGPTKAAPSHCLAYFDLYIGTSSHSLTTCG